MALTLGRRLGHVFCTAALNWDFSHCFSHDETKAMGFGGRSRGKEPFLSCQGYALSTRLITTDADLDPVSKVSCARLPHWEGIPSTFRVVLFGRKSVGRAGP